MAFEKDGFPRAAGRVLGWLTVCDPPHQTAREIAEAIGVSLGAVSSAAREMSQAGLVERFSLPGERATRMRIRTSCWGEHIRNRACACFAGLHELADKGFELLENERSHPHRRLRELKEAGAFFEQEFMKLFERFEKRQAGERG